VAVAAAAAVVVVVAVAPLAVVPDAPAVRVAPLAVRPSVTAVSAEARHFRLHDEDKDLIGRARSSTRPILVFVRLVVFARMVGSLAANNFRIHQKMLARRRRCRRAILHV
jgi:hypothetical protein